MHGQFVWYELMTSDIEGAKRFYAPITSWGTQPFDQSYTLWTSSGTPFAGLHQLGPTERAQGIPPNWMPYVESSDVAETVRLASSLGARIIEGPREIPNVGTFAVIQDPQSAVFGVLDSKGRRRAWDGTPVVGRFSWHELMTTDLSKAFEFYKRLFGWEQTGEMDMGGGNKYLMYGKGKPFGGMFARPPEMAGMHPFWLSYIHVKDVNKAFETAKKNGAYVQRPPMEIPGGMIAIMGDPQGAAFAVHHQSAASTGTGTTSGKAKKAATKSRTKPAKKAASKKHTASKKRRPAARKTRAAASKRGTKKTAARRRGAKGATKRGAKGATKRGTKRPLKRGTRRGR